MVPAPAPGARVGRFGRALVSCSFGGGPLRARGVIFDLDGTLVDNMAVHAEAFSIFVARHGLPPESRRAGVSGPGALMS